MEIDKCGDCFAAVCREAALLRGGDWRVGEDGRRHWRRSYQGAGVCGVRVLADSGGRFLYDQKTKGGL